MFYLYKIYFLFFMLVFSFSSLTAQDISGMVTDEAGEPMPFVSVYIKNTTRGTSTNEDGKYNLKIQEKDRGGIIVFRFIGYKTLEVPIQNRTSIDAQMQSETTTLREIVVSNKYEDPAYDMIREAQKRRKKYLNEVEEFSCETYIKGTHKLTKLGLEDKSAFSLMIPKEDREELDSIGSLGNIDEIVYLSESMSTYYFQAPSREKEIMHSSRVSGDSRGFSWNSARVFNFNFYKPNVSFGLSARDFISPIAPTAFAHYDYKWRGSYKEDSLEVHKIEVIPKRRSTPLFHGMLYLQDGSWRIHATELYALRESGMDFVDTLFIDQVYVPVEGGAWLRSTQHLRAPITIDLMGFKVGLEANFIGIFSDFDLSPDFERGFFGREKMRILEGSNERDSSYWQGRRPVPLSVNEFKDYKVKDSVYQVVNSDAYKDSVQQYRNKFRFRNVYGGYTYHNLKGNYKFKFGSLLAGGVQFNTVEGWILQPSVGFTKENPDKYSKTEIDATARYGFSSNSLYSKGGIQHRFNSTNRLTIAAGGGRFVRQFNPDAIDEFLNSYSAVFYRQSFVKLYESQYGMLGVGAELLNGVYIKTNAKFERRLALQNAEPIPPVLNWFNRDAEFTSNNPLQPESDELLFDPHHALTWETDIEIRFGQQYRREPRRKINYPTRYPILKMRYLKGIEGIAQSATNFDFASASLSHDISLGLLGRLYYAGESGLFLNRNSLFFPDFHHFQTTEISVVSRQGTQQFMLLPYYSHSTSDYYGEFHVEHHFNGFILNSLPLVRKLNWQLIASGRYLHTAEQGDYFEWGVGLKNIFRFLRVDFVGSVNAPVGASRFGFRLRLDSPFVNF
ncbi:MAG: carboxypeptidase-like regulatory domain-containing protein [Bernardetiaceae bacterium]|nr:carboxypeptidase-like regulatory domain-containing protein [Bernardetiaceae bacterium]